MKEELLKKLHTAMCNDNEHQCNRLNNYIHTDEYLTAEVVQVVNEIVVEETKELKEQNKELTLKVSRLESDCDAYNYSQRTYQEEIKELKAENEQIKNSDTLCKLIGEQKRKITELEAQIEKLIDFVLSKTECCDVCPMTDTCINSEGTCPYAGILLKDEEAVTRKWLLQFISKEIKEK